MQTVDYGLAEVFEYVYKQQNIGQQVVVVILSMFVMLNLVHVCLAL